MQSNEVCLVGLLCQELEPSAALVPAVEDPQIYYESVVMYARYRPARFKDMPVRAMPASFVQLCMRFQYQPAIVKQSSSRTFSSLTLPTKVQSTFKRVIPAGTFASSAFAEAFFRSKRCFRYDQSTCFQPGHEYYEVRIVLTWM